VVTSLTHTELSIERHQRVQQHDNQRTPEVRIITDDVPLETKLRQRQHDAAQFVVDVSDVDIKLFAAQITNTNDTITT